MDNNVFLYTRSGEEHLKDALELIKEEVYFKSRGEAFEDCTKYWTKQIQKVLKKDCSDKVKIRKVQQLFNIDGTSDSL
ncbi:hypothetical protein AADC60_10575 [Cytobacillus pseudoceanisediminis]|uniref:Uncharacterized protein n=1 Tax=Cytobacillus pseudoceanisediminis TaxID=3051614 RepID=A0ABZ2ZN52_9BACI